MTFHVKISQLDSTLGQKNFGFYKASIEQRITINVPLFLEVRDFMFFPTKKHKIPNF
jgi:hypothetical protein